MRSRCPVLHLLILASQTLVLMLNGLDCEEGRELTRTAVIAMVRGCCSFIGIHTRAVSHPKLRFAHSVQYLQFLSHDETFTLCERFLIVGPESTQTQESLCFSSSVARPCSVRDGFIR